MHASPLATPSATRAVLERHGITLKKSLGQHFLVDDNVVGRILALAALPPDAVVLEIGPGIGTLTRALCAHARAVVAVEADGTLLPVLDEVRADFCGLEVVHADAVRVPLDRLTTAAGPPTHLVANLPYAVAATVVLRCFEGVPSLQAAVVMVQAEVADRMAASPGSKAYGAYTVKLGLFARPAGRFTVPRSCFMPPPRVDSAVIRLDRAERAGREEVAAASDMAAAAFATRRKTLRNSVLGARSHSAGEVDAVLSAASVDGSRRAESLTVDEYLALGRAARQQGLLP